MRQTKTGKTGFTLRWRNLVKVAYEQALKINSSARVFLRPRESMKPWTTRVGERSCKESGTISIISARPHKSLLDTSQIFPEAVKRVVQC